MTTQLSKSSLLLLKKLEEGRQKNNRWSQRSFAKRLGVSSGALSEILSGKRSLSNHAKKKIATKLELSPFEMIDFFEDELPAHLQQTKLEYHILSNDQFHMISDWWHYAILNLINTKGFKPLPSWISERLGVSIKITTEAWERLFRLGHLQRQRNKVVRAFPRLNTTDDILNLSVRKSHLEDLKLIEKSLLEAPVQLRDHTSVTLTMNKNNLKKAKELIRLFQDSFTNEIESTPAEEVYKLSISLYPLTQVTEPK